MFDVNLYKFLFFCVNRGCFYGSCMCRCFMSVWLFLRSFVIGCCCSMRYERGVVGESL